MKRRNADTSRTPKQEQHDCASCDGRCCTYFAMELDRPSTQADYDNLRWYIAHENINLFIEGRDWYLQVNNPCRYLTADKRCAIYERRPQICRDYGQPGTETECHGAGQSEDHDVFLATLEELESYLRRHGKRWTRQPSRAATSRGRRQP